MTADEHVTAAPRRRGRPRLEVDRDAIADAVAELFAEGGYDAVSIGDTAKKLAVSRATLYRTVPNKNDLLSILFERSIDELFERANASIQEFDDSRDQLVALIHLQADGAFRMRSYMSVIFGGQSLPADVFHRFHSVSRRYEELWVKVVSAAIDDGYLKKEDPVVAARLLLGMIIWVTRWYRSGASVTATDIADTAIGLLRL